ncbi:MAG: adenylyltransferase/cytidyltransferase family protein [Lentisphaeria bacterium]|nr:adenylyltransferase/cytidyltransferase family protein [Lentisphaeria bacterium]
MTLEQAVAWRRELGARGLRLAVTNGCFDLLHRGHVQYLHQARQLADALLVATNSDRSIRLVKGPDRPVVHEADRAYMLTSLRAVDAVVVFDSEKPLPLFEALQPDVYVKGGDYTVDTIVQEERRLLERLGVEIRFVQLIEGQSTTTTIRKVRNGA